MPRFFAYFAHRWFEPAWLAPAQCGLVMAVLGLALTNTTGNAPVWGQSPPAGRPPAELDILPLLTAKCGQCHGPDRKEANLDLTTAAGLASGGESGPVLSAEMPAAGLLLKRVQAGEMPPQDAAQLTAEERQQLENWLTTNGPAFVLAQANAGMPSVPTQHQVIPILLRRCTVCHGRQRREAGLDLRDKAAMLRGGKSGPAIVPGEPEASLLLQKVRQSQMPPLDQLVEVSIKPMEPAEIEVISRWIAAGAPEVDTAADLPSEAHSRVSAEDRAFWAFQAPCVAPAPAMVNDPISRNLVDAFLLQKLAERGLSFAPQAERGELIRRATFDLTGLPPSPREVAAFLEDESPDAYERLLDRLLASPHYGERWGRHWLDLAGYADSEGKREQDLPRPHVWRYRDYVIQSLDADKPYDQFLTEQIAGDELADYAQAETITPQMADQLVATGFMKLAPDPTWANITGFVPDRLEVISDQMDIFGSVVLGLTLKCAKCHSHKFDPLPQRDYYRVVDLFKGALDEYNWLKPDVRPGLGPLSADTQPGRLLPYVSTQERQAWETACAEIDRQVAELTASHPAETRPPEITAKLAQLAGQRPPQPLIHALWDRGEPSPTYVYRRGDPLSPGELVTPGVPAVLAHGLPALEVRPPFEGATSTGRRLALARWLTQPGHPLVARVQVNRLWQQHFGVGIVKTIGNFGRAGAPPSHLELLDVLAVRYTQKNWSNKWLHRLLLSSAAYQQSSAASPDALSQDPDNTWLSRMPLKRQSAESLYDALLVASGELDATRFGPADRVEGRADGLISAVRGARGYRRLVYVAQARKQIPTHLETFDFPQMNPNCLERRDSTVAPQALHLMNSGLVRNLAERFAERVLREATPNAADTTPSHATRAIRRVELAYQIALGRQPTEEERQLSVQTLEALTQAYLDELKATMPPDGDAQAICEQRALAVFCHSLFNSAAFLYID